MFLYVIVLNVSNSISDSDSKVSIISEKCCLDIEPNDTDCEVCKNKQY